MAAYRSDVAMSDPAEPAGFVVLVEPGDRIHFADWGGTGSPAVLLVHGLGATSRIWAPVARRLAAVRHVVAMDLRGHGLSDAPTEPDAYDLDRFGGDVIAVAEGSAILDDGRVVLVGHGFGAIAAATAAAVLGPACAGLVLVDGGLETMADATGVDADEFLRGLDEPPEVLRSMGAFLADRRSWDPASWDDDQEAAARSTVVETPAGRLVPVTRPHVTEATVRAMFDYEPATVLERVSAPVLAIRRITPGDDTSRLPSTPGGMEMRTVELVAPGHNLLRYRPDEVSRAILAVTNGDDGR
jgi:pimeloyl-ACP methyl ester carboxylesterase